MKLYGHRAELESGEHVILESPQRLSAYRSAMLYNEQLVEVADEVVVRVQLPGTHNTWVRVP